MLIDLDGLLQRVGSKYLAVILAAKRARQIVHGAVPLVETPAVKPVSIALEELIQGRLEYRPPEVEGAGETEGAQGAVAEEVLAGAEAAEAAPAGEEAAAWGARPPRA